MKINKFLYLFTLILFLIGCEPIPPRAVIQGPDMVVVGQTVHYHGRSSEVDRNSIYTLYDWQVGERVIGSAPNVVLNWDKPGKYEVKLTVTDSEGLSDTAVMEVLVLQDFGN